MLHQRKKIDEAYDLIEKSLQIQPLQVSEKKISFITKNIQVGAWFTLGHCAWRLERYVEATRAYHRCVAIEPDNFEAWNNLSAAFIRLGQKERALKILQVDQKSWSAFQKNSRNL